MPLLRNENFVPNKVNGLPGDQKVFYLSLTKEIFDNYDEFFERSILCNSLVWGCSVTGKSNLTYYDAVKSEQKALKHIEVLPDYFHTPILILTRHANCGRISDLAGFVSSFFKHRFVIGEKVQISCDGVKTSGLVIAIKCPAVQAYHKLGDVVSVPVPPAEEMRYVVKCGTSMKFEKSSKKNGLSPVKSTSTAVFNAFALARFGHKSGTVEAINKVKLGAFLKVCCRITNKRVIVKEEFASQKSLENKCYEDYFGPIPLPDFAVSSDEVEQRKQVLAKANLFLTSNSRTAQIFDSNGIDRKRIAKAEPEGQPKKKKAKISLESNGNVANKSNAMTPTEHPVDVKPRKSEIEEKLEELRKEKEREEKRLRAEWLKRWNRIRDDLELEDHQEFNPLPTAMSPHLGSNSFTGEAVFPGIISILDFFNTFSEMIKVEQYLPDSKISFAYLVEALHDSNVFGKLYLILSCLMTNVMSCLDEALTYDLSLDEQSEILNELANWELVSDDNQNVLLKASETVFYCLSHLGMPLTRLPISPYTISEVLRLLFLASGFKPLAEIVKLKTSRWNNFNVREDPLVDFKCSHRHILNKLDSKSIYRLNVEDKVKILNALCDELLSIKAELKELVANSGELILETKSELKKFQKTEAKWRRDITTARVHRRYWKFRSVPGVYIEEDSTFRKWAEMNGPKGHYTPPCLVDQTNGGITPNWEIEEMAEQGFNGEPMFPKWPQLNSIPSGREFKTNWSFLSTQSAIDNLISKLNPRGTRELALRENLTAVKKYLFRELENSESHEVFELMTEYDPSEMSFQCSNLDLVEIFCKTCKIFFERLASGPFLNHSLTFQDKQQMFSQINRGFIRDANASISGATSVQSYADILCKITSAIRKDFLGAPLVSKSNSDEFLTLDANYDPEISNGESNGSSNSLISVCNTPFIERWMNAIQSSSGFAKLFLYLQILNLSVKWSKPSTNVGVKKICSSCFVQSTGMNDHMQMCKICNVAYHKNEYCFGLKHNTICCNCFRYRAKLTSRKANHDSNQNGSSNSRNSRSGAKNGTENEQQNGHKEEEEDIFAILPVLDDGVFCALCGLGGFVLCCEKCPKMFHLRCADPPLKAVPPNNWYCQLCTKKVTVTEFELTKKSKQKNTVQNLTQSKLTKYW
ncbi:bromodomain adjacent to zinc finger domain protein 1A-like isoform X2 [Convolutriloba macropyga]|uniref:bromodomain adjacent to zinc finger domain protein 1A-like isoform X2 n=1 Tax=Convolutriloba macropyga TaxID=536237 RepID=UPI003F5251D2